MDKIYYFLKKNKFFYVCGKTIKKFIWKERLRKRNKIFQKNGMETLIFIQKILKEKNIEFFVAFGTLLGIIREKKLLTHDIDLDIALIGNKINWVLLEEVLLKNNFIKIHEFYFEGEISEQSYNYKGIVVDFFHCCLKNNKVYFYCFERYATENYSSIKMYSTQEYSVEPFKNIIELELENNINILIPDNFEEHLRQIYGNDWKIPDKNWSEDKSLALKILYKKYAYIKKFKN